MSNELSKPNFPAYSAFLGSVKLIDEFQAITSLSYGITLQLLFHQPPASGPKPKTRGSGSQPSFTPADIEITGIKEICRWVTVAEFSTQTGRPIEEVQRLATSGKLGPIEHSSAGDILVLWPENNHTNPPKRLPEPGKKTFSITSRRKEIHTLETDLHDSSAFQATQHQFLQLAHALGSPEEVGERALAALHRSCLLLRWTAFEVFIRSTIHELYRRHPHTIARGKRGKNATVSYEEIVSLSDQLTDITKFRANLVNRTIESEAGDGQSVHGLINLIKTEFRFKSDPYESWYILEGVKLKTSYGDLMAIKDTRNALIHDAGRPLSDFFAKYPDVKNKDGEIEIDDNLILKFNLILDSIAHKISDTILQNNYQP